VNKFGLAPEVLEDILFRYALVEKLLSEVFKRDGMKKLRTAVLISTVGVSKDDVVAVSDEVKV
jgi:hypothetical protein